jgi:predicted DNA-binding transcriptional regulator AlpA
MPADTILPLSRVECSPAVSISRPPGPVSPAPAIEPLLLDARALAGLLSVSVATVWRWAAAGRLPLAVKPSPGVKRWRREQIETWVRWGCPPRKQFEAMRESEDQGRRRPG